MARPLTLMSAALLTAAASAVLPYALPINDATTPPTPTAPPAVLSPSSLLTPSANGPPVPPNIAPAPAGGGSTMVLSPSAVTVINQSQSKIVNVDNPPFVFEQKDEIYGSNLLLRSSSGWRHQVKLELAVLRDREGSPLNAQLKEPQSEGVPIEPFAVINQRLEMSVTPASGKVLLLPASGWLRLLASPQNANATTTAATDPKKEPTDPGYLYLPIVINAPKLEGLDVVMTISFVSLGIAALIVGITIWSLLKRGMSLLTPMGGATWSFEQSWGANVTIGAAILGTFLTLLAFPSHPHIMEKTSYSLLQVIFATLIALAPLVYGLIRRNIQVNANGIAAVDTQGFVIMFLLAGGLVLWGALGQVITFGVLVEEFVLSGNLARSLGRATQVLAGFLCLLLITYGLRSLYRTAKNLSRVDQQLQPPSFRSGTALTTAQQSTFGPPMPEWPLL